MQKKQLKQYVMQLNFSGNLKSFLQHRYIFIRHPNAFATQTHSEIATPFYRTARNDDIVFSQPEIILSFSG